MIIRLEPVEYRHLSFIKNLRNLTEVMDFCRQPYMLNEIDQEEWLKRCSKTKEMLPFVVVDKTRGEGKEWVGYAALSHFDWIAKKAECSYVMHPEVSGDLHGVEAIFQLLYYGFYVLGLNKIYSDTFDYNQKEIQINGQLGFEVSGTNPEHYFKRGKLIGSISMYFLRRKFDEMYKDRLESIKYAESKPL